MEQEKVSVVPIDAKSIELAKEQKQRLKEFIESQLIDGVDFGMIPKSRKPSLFKPGAEKLARLFQLGIRVVDKWHEINRENKWAIFSYTMEVYSLNTGIGISQCEGSANSGESKYRNVPFSDVLNTLQKMGQKRAQVGAVISAVSASDFYTHDVEDAQEHVNHAPTIHQTEPDSAPKTLPNGLAISYVIPFGKFKGKHLSEISRQELEQYCDYILDRGVKEGKGRNDMSDMVQEFLHLVEGYLFGGGI